MTIARISRDCARRFRDFADVVRDHIAAAPVKDIWTRPAFGSAAGRDGYMSPPQRC